MEGRYSMKENATDVLMELSTLANDFEDCTVVETMPGKGQQPTQTRSIDIAQVCAYFAMVENATKEGHADDAALIAAGRKLIANARWHDEEAEGQGPLW